MGIWEEFFYGINLLYVVISCGMKFLQSFFVEMASLAHAVSMFSLGSL